MNVMKREREKEKKNIEKPKSGKDKYEVGINKCHFYRT